MGSHLNVVPFERNTCIQERRVLVNGEHLRYFSGTLVSCCVLDFYKYCHVCGKQNKSSGTVNIILRHKQKGCLQSTPSTPSVLHHTGKASTGNTLCAVLAQRNLGETWTKVRATKGGHWESPKVSQCNSGGQARTKWNFRSGGFNKKWRNRSLCIYKAVAGMRGTNVFFACDG